MSMTLVKNEAFKPEQHSIEECLIELERYGFPKVTKVNKDGWHSYVNVFVTGQGVSFEVKSDFGMSTPKVAINQCYDRLIEAIKKNKET